LYQGFERRWAYYKVIQLACKTLILLPLILMIDPVHKAWISSIMLGSSIVHGSVPMRKEHG